MIPCVCHQEEYGDIFVPQIIIPRRHRYRHPEVIYLQQVIQKQQA